LIIVFFFYFFQAEDGIRNRNVTGLQSCALPIYEMIHAASVTGDRSGIVMDVYTEEPGMQFYTGNFMQGKNTFKSGAKDEYRTAFCIETQHFPDSPNQSDFPSIRLDPNQKYHTVTVYRFSAKNRSGIE